MFLILVKIDKKCLCEPTLINSTGLFILYCRFAAALRIEYNPDLMTIVLFTSFETNVQTCI